MAEALDVLDDGDIPEDGGWALEHCRLENRAFGSPEPSVYRKRYL